jgi:hypothetical protein
MKDAKTGRMAVRPRLQKYRAVMLRCMVHILCRDDDGGVIKKYGEKNKNQEKDFQSLFNKRLSYYIKGEKIAGKIQKDKGLI